jgi:hypothetical protein
MVPLWTATCSPAAGWRRSRVDATQFVRAILT